VSADCGRSERAAASGERVGLRKARFPSRGHSSASETRGIVGAHHESARPRFVQLCKYATEVTFAAGVKDMKRQPKAVRGRQHISRVGFGKNGSGRVDKERHDLHRRKKLM
jgi:hypothetical protein